jgi:hypothetical protein
MPTRLSATPVSSLRCVMWADRRFLFVIGCFRNEPRPPVRKRA